MKIAIACDHGALSLKNAVIAHLEKKGYEISFIFALLAKAIEHIVAGIYEVFLSEIEFHSAVKRLVVVKMSSVKLTEGFF